MPDSEKSYYDRLQRAQTLHGAVSGFIPPYSSQRPEISMVNFGTFLTTVDGLNETASQEVTDYGEMASQRVALVKSMGPIMTRTMNCLKANPKWKAALRQTKTAADKFRGVRPSRSTKPPQETGQPGKKTRNQSDRSYADLAGHFRRFVQAVKKAADYVPPADDLAIGSVLNLCGY